MFKKILSILTIALCCVSCEENAMRERDMFVIKRIELNEYEGTSHYKYRYYLLWLQKYKRDNNMTFLDVMYFYSDKEYELGDTIQMELKNCGK